MNVKWIPFEWSVRELSGFKLTACGFLSYVSKMCFLCLSHNGTQSVSWWWCSAAWCLLMAWCLTRWQDSRVGLPHFWWMQIADWLITSYDYDDDLLAGLSSSHSWSSCDGFTNDWKRFQGFQASTSQAADSHQTDCPFKNPVTTRRRVQNMSSKFFKDWKWLKICCVWSKDSNFRPLRHF